MSTVDKDFKALPDDMDYFVHSLINGTVVSVSHEEDAVIYKLRVVGNQFLELARDFFTQDGKSIDVMYTISLYDEDTEQDEDIAYLTTNIRRRIFTPSEQKIINLFNECSKRIIQQELQLIQNRIASLTSEYTHN